MTASVRTDQEPSKAPPELPAPPPIDAAPPERPARRATSESEMSVIGAGVIIIGELESSTVIQIEGRIEGDVRGHIVKIGSMAVIKGSVGGDNVEVSGKIDGTIAAQNVTLLKGARVDGEIIYASLEFGPEARFEGRCNPHFSKKSAGSAEQRRPL
jgi:cytoskeletal protein CcmA (bactofilin family)